MATIEEMVTAVSREVVPDRPLAASPFPRLTYDEALARYGSDKPDVRFGMELVDIGEALAGTDLHIFTDALAAGGAVRAVVAAGCAGFSRRQTDELTEPRCATAPAAWSTSPSRRTARSAGRWPATCRPPPRSRSARRAGRHPATSSWPWPMPMPTRAPRLFASGSSSPRSSSSGRRTSCHTCGSTASRCSSGTPRATAGTRPTTRSAPRCGRWPTTSNAIPPRSTPSSTTWP